MAVLSASQFTIVYQSGEAERVILASVRGVTTTDTFDAASVFRKIAQAFFMSTTGTGLGTCTIAGTVITFAPVGLALDGGFILAIGTAV